MMDVLNVNWKVGAEFFKKILCVKLFIVISYVCRLASINVFLWRVYVVITGVHTTELKV